MEILAAGGSRVQALLVDNELRQRLHDDLAIAPSDATQALDRSLLAPVRTVNARAPGSGRVEVADEAGQPVLEPDAPAVRAPAVDHDDAEVL